VQDFGELSDYDFEQVVADLLAAEWQVRVETFPRGRDGGVDLRVIGPTSAPLNIPAQKELTVQCKHMPGAAMPQLRSHLRAEATNDVVNTAYRYVFATSARLTRLNKQEIVKIYGGRISETDIYGRNDVDDLLRRHPEVVRANMKLWLASGTALQAFLGQVEALRSNALRAELQQLRSRLVWTSVAAVARQMVRQYGVCILAGAPGVGKTTTARILLLQFMSEGWQPVVAVSDVRELEQQVIPGTKQILFFDDFLGVFSLESKLAGGHDAALVRLIRLVEKDADKIFVLTTREYILRQAQQTYENLSDEIFAVAKHLVRIEELTTAERTHIMYNQLYYSQLRPAVIADHGCRAKCAKLTGHKNYNPRLVEMAIAAAVRDLGLRPNRLISESSLADRLTGRNIDIPALIRKALDSPVRMWEHVLLRQLNELHRLVLVTRLSLGSAPVRMADLLRAAAGVCIAFGRTPSALDLDMALAVLDSDFLTVTRETVPPDQPVVGPLHAGIVDAVIAMLQRYDDYVNALMASISGYEQVKWLAAFFGVTGSSRSRTAEVPQHRALELVKCAERNLFAGPMALDYGLWPAEVRQYSDFGSRMEVLEAIYRRTGQVSTAEVAETFFRCFLSALAVIPGPELVSLLAVLRSVVFRAWRGRRTDIRVAVLSKLDDPDDVDGWSVLRDALDLVETTPEYREELVGRLNEFLESAIVDVKDVLDEARIGDDDAELPIGELAELSDLAERWGIVTEIDDLIEQTYEIEERREAERRERDALANHPTLF
jgi:hypothetical protein